MGLLTRILSESSNPRRPEEPRGLAGKKNASDFDSRGPRKLRLPSILTRQSRNQRGARRAPRTVRDSQLFIQFRLAFTRDRGSFEQAAGLYQRLLRVQDFGLTGAAKHSEIRTYLGLRPVIIVRSRFTGAT